MRFEKECKKLKSFLLGELLIGIQHDIVAHECPHCGSDSTREAYCGLEDGYPMHRIHCKSCGSYLLCWDDIELRLRWNAGEHYCPDERRYYDYLCPTCNGDGWVEKEEG